MGQLWLRIGLGRVGSRPSGCFSGPDLKAVKSSVLPAPHRLLCRVLCSGTSASSSSRPRVPLSLPQLPLQRSSPHMGPNSLRTPTYRPPSSVSPPIMHSHAHGGHGHHHHHDNTFLTSTNKNDAGVRITRYGLFVNLGMAISKTFGGYVFNSAALVADGFHALTDLVSDFMTLATISVALKPPTVKYPNGFGKVESFGSLFVSGLLLAGGCVMAMHSGHTLYLQAFADAAHHVHEHAHEVHEHSHGMFSLGHSHSAHDMIPDLNAAWLAAGSIVVKEWLYRATMKVARERKSSILASNAVHHRVDSLTSIVALIAIGGAHIIEGATWLDPVGGLLVSILVIHAGLGNTKSAVIELCDASIDDEVKESVKKAAGKALAASESDITGTVRAVEGVKAGQNYLVDIQVAASATLSLTELSVLEENVREAVAARVRGVKRLRIRFVPQGSEVGDFAGEFIAADVVQSPRQSQDDHDHDHEHDHDHDNHNHDHEHKHSNGRAKGSAKANGSATKRR